MDNRPRVLLTGATGLIGHEFCLQAAEGLDLWAVVRNTPPRHRPGKWIEHNLANPQLPPSLPENTDTVIHLAQSPHFRDFPEKAMDVFQVNVGSTARLLDWSRQTGVRRFIYASSGGIYGHGAKEFNEDDPAGPHGPLGHYLATKHSGELLVENYADQMIVVLLRFFFVYGFRQRETMLIPRLLRSVREGKPIRLQGHDGIRLNPIHVSDAAAAVVNALRLEESHKINIGGPEVMTLGEVARTMGDLVGREPVLVMEESDAGHLVGDVSKMSRLLRPPSITLEAGLRRMLEESGEVVPDQGAGNG